MVQCSNTKFLRYTPRNSKKPQWKYFHKDVIPDLDPKYFMSNSFNAWTQIGPGMTDPIQWIQTPERSSEVFHVRFLHYSRYKSQTRTLSLIWFPKVLSEFLLRVPGGPKNRLWTSSDPGHSCVPFHKFWNTNCPLRFGCPWSPWKHSKEDTNCPLRSGCPWSPWKHSKEAPEVLPHLTVLTSTMNLEDIFLQLWCIWFKMP